MSVVVEHEDAEELRAWGLGLCRLLERCCKCRAPTPYWYTPHDVALCQACAETAEPADIPSKDEWLAKERKLEKRVV